MVSVERHLFFETLNGNNYNRCVALYRNYQTSRGSVVGRNVSNIEKTIINVTSIISDNNSNYNVISKFSNQACYYKHAGFDNYTFWFISFQKLGLDLMPDLEFPVLTISTTYEGAAAEDVEQLVTRPIEQAVSTIKGIVEYSTSSEGLSVVTVTFEWGTTTLQDRYP